MIMLYLCDYFDNYAVDGFAFGGSLGEFMKEGTHESTRGTRAPAKGNNPLLDR